MILAKKKNIYLFLLLFIFFFTRYLLNIYFNVSLSPLSYSYHLLDKSLLHNDLLKSLFYMHHQPYLWNLFNGIVLKIFDGDLNKIKIFITVYHQILTLISIWIFYKIMCYFKLSNKTVFYILIFFTICPSILFYENIFSYTHTSFFLFNCLAFAIIKFFLFNKKDRYEISIYFFLFLLGNTWLLFNPLILLLIAFVILRFFKKINTKNLIYFTVFFLISFSPIIKNKIVFGEYILASKSGHDIKDIFYDYEKYCGNPMKNISQLEAKYFEKYNKNLTHPSVVGAMSKFNNVGMIIYSQECLKITLDRLKSEKLFYLKGRIFAFLAAHGKFSFDHMSVRPSGWDNFYSFFYNAYKNENIKLIRQLIIFLIKMYIYFTILKFLLLINYDKNFKTSIFFITISFLYLFLIAIFLAGTEQERILYTGYIIFVCFLCIFFKNKCLK